MEETKAIDKVTRATVDTHTVVPVSAYPTEILEQYGSQSIRDYWRVIRKRGWTIIGLLLLTVVTVMIATFKEKPIYRSTTILQIDREAPSILSFQGFVAEMNPYDNSYLETAYQILQSRSLAARVIRKLDLSKFEEFAGATPSWLSSLWLTSKPKVKQLVPEEQLDPQFSAAIDSFLRQLSVTPVRRSQLVEISYESSDPIMSARIANTVAANYIDMNLEAKWEATQKASDWLSQQLVGLKAKLEKSEEELQSYAKANSILFVDEKQSMNSQKLQQLQAEATKAQADLIQKESLYNQIRGGDLSSVPGASENKLYQDLALKLTDLRQQYTELSATFEPEYPRLKRLKSQIEEVTATIEKERASFAQRAQDDYRAAANRSRLLEQAVAQQAREFNQIAEKSIQYNILKREADTNKELYDGLLQRLKEASVSAGMRASNVRVVDEAEIPESPAKPRKLLNLALSILIGLAVGLGMAFLQEYLDNTLKSSEDVQRYLHLPTLGIIPANTRASRKKLGSGIYGARRRALPEVVESGSDTVSPTGPQFIHSDANSPVSEAYRSLRTSVLLSTSGRPPRIILVTSAHPGEGKTTTASNLAIALSQLGGTVLIIDSDMRRPRVGALLDLKDSAAGLSTYLTGTYVFEEVSRPTKVPNLYAVTCGPVPPNPAELLSSEMMQKLLDEASASFDYVVLDSPPVLHVSDSRILAARVEATVLVAHGATTPREVVKRARELLTQVNANIIGVLLNNMDTSLDEYGYYRNYYGSYGYGDESKRRSEKL